MPSTDTDLPFYVALAGPTASGKTAAALLVASHLPCEIISVDSALVYRGLDIGSAKPTPQERAQVVHHLIDIRDPLHAYSAAEFVRDARQLIPQIHARGHLPLLVGGTMLYLKALTGGLDDLPPADATIRQALEREAQALGWPALHAQLAQIDARTAARLAPGDSQRIQRALEVYRLTGRPLSDFHHASTRAAEKSAAAGAGDATPPLLIALEPAERTWLHARIERRFDAMMESGFVDEVRSLRARGDLHPDLPSMRCVGYRQAWQALDGSIPWSELRPQAIAATRQLAKRQLTWLRSMPQRVCIGCEHDDAPQRVLHCVQQALAAHHSI